MARWFAHPAALPIKLLCVRRSPHLGVHSSTTLEPFPPSTAQQPACQTSGQSVIKHCSLVKILCHLFTTCAKLLPLNPSPPLRHPHTRCLHCYCTKRHFGVVSGALCALDFLACSPQTSVSLMGDKLIDSLTLKNCRRGLHACTPRSDTPCRLSLHVVHFRLRPSSVTHPGLAVSKHTQPIAPPQRHAAATEAAASKLSSPVLRALLFGVLAKTLHSPSSTAWGTLLECVTAYR